MVALPMALAFGVASGAGAMSGLWGAVLVGLFAALFGGTPTLISETTGPMTVVMMAGALEILFGFLKLGRYITMMHYTVISGFMSGIGFILIILHFGPFLGQAIPKGGVMGTLKPCPS